MASNALNVANMSQVGPFRVIRPLDSGIQASVALAQHQETQEYVALKLVHHRRRNAANALRQEGELLKDSNHPNVVGLIDSASNMAVTLNNGRMEQFDYLALELARSNLFELVSRTGAFSEAIARLNFQELLAALQHCHKLGITHHDLKPENILIGASFEMKLADFGMADRQTRPDQRSIQAAGTTGYQAPEVLAHQQPYDPFKADIWSAGMVLFIMLQAAPPLRRAKPGDWGFDHLAGRTMHRFWRSYEQHHQHLSDNAKDLLSQILTVDPAARPSIEQILEHPWMQGEVPTFDDLYADMVRREGLMEGLLPDVFQRRDQPKEADPAQSDHSDDNGQL